MLLGQFVAISTELLECYVHASCSMVQNNLHVLQLLAIKSFCKAICCLIPVCTWLLIACFKVQIIHQCSCYLIGKSACM